MIRNHTGKHGSGVIRRLPMLVQGDEAGEIRNGLPEPRYYRPRLTAEQQARYDRLTGRNTGADASAVAAEDRSEYAQPTTE